jgi:hypothetical protein
LIVIKGSFPVLKLPGCFSLAREAGDAYVTRLALHRPIFFRQFTMVIPYSTIKVKVQLREVCLDCGSGGLDGSVSYPPNPPDPQLIKDCEVSPLVFLSRIA